MYDETGESDLDSADPMPARPLRVNLRPYTHEWNLICSLFQQGVEAEIIKCLDNEGSVEVRRWVPTLEERTISEMNTLLAHAGSRWRIRDPRAGPFSDQNLILCPVGSGRSIS